MESNAASRMEHKKEMPTAINAKTISKNMQAQLIKEEAGIFAEFSALHNINKRGRSPFCHAGVAGELIKSCNLLKATHCGRVQRCCNRLSINIRRQTRPIRNCDWRDLRPAGY